MSNASSAATKKVDTFSDGPTGLYVKPLAGCIADLLDDSTIDISPDLEAGFEAAIEDIRPAEATLRKQHLRFTRSFGELANEFPLDRLKFRRPDQLWLTAALVTNQGNGGDGDLDLYNANAIASDDGRVISMTFKNRRWSLESHHAEHVFQEGTQIILPS